MENNPCVYHVWQMKLLFAQVENHNTYFYKDKDGKNHYGTLISNEFCFSMKQKINRYMDSWESCLSRYLKKYITRCDDRFNSISGTNMKKLVSYITFHEVPKGVTDDNLYSEDINLLDLLTQTDASSIELKCLQNIMKILNSDINMDSM